MYYVEAYTFYLEHQMALSFFAFVLLFALLHFVVCCNYWL